MKVRQNYAEEMDAPQSGMEHPASHDDHAAGLSEPVSKLLEAAEAIKSQAETIGLTIDGIGLYLLNEDGTVRDFTNVKLMNDIGKKVDDGLSAMNANATNIEESIKNMPTQIDATFSASAFTFLNVEFKRAADPKFTIRGTLSLSSERIKFLTFGSMLNA